jgi:hypothetical protein
VQVVGVRVRACRAGRFPVFTMRSACRHHIARKARLWARGLGGIVIVLVHVKFLKASAALGSKLVPIRLVNPAEDRAAADVLRNHLFG